MKKYIIIISVFVIVLALVGFGLWFFKKDKPPEKPLVETVTEALSKKYNQPSSEFSVQVEANSGTYAKGIYNQASGDRGIWFAAKTKQGWESAFAGTDIVTCEIANKYNFPNDIIPKCLVKSPSGSSLISR